MLRKLAGIAVVAMVAAIGQLAGPAAPAQAATTAPAFGVQFHATWGDYTEAQRIALLDKLAAAKIGWVRIDIGWRAWEEHGKGVISQWQADMMDRIVAAADARGIKILGTLWHTPAWANGNQSATTPPHDPAEYARFARYISERYRGRIAAWEVWNEPNLDAFFVGTDPVRYAALVRAAYPAFKAGDPGALVVAGSVSLNDDGWLKRMYDAGVSGSFDVLSTHPYQGPADAPPELVDDGNRWILDHIGAVHRLMVARGDGHKPIWATEYGWSSHANTGSEPSWKRGVTEQQQADYLLRSLSWFGSRHPYVTNVFWYNERNKATGDAQEDNYGILRRDLSDKPAYAAVKSLLAGQTSQPSQPAPTTTTTTAPKPAPSTTTTTAPKPAPTTTTTAPPPPPPPVAAAGPAAPPTATPLSYRLVARDGRTFGFGESGSLGATGALPVRPGHGVVAAVAPPSGQGAWVTTSDGSVFATGGAPFHGSAGGLRLNQPIVGMDGTPTGNGYWLVASDGGIFAFGDARFFGSTGGIKLNQDIVGMAPTADGSGYWLVASDGGIFAFGNARFLGSTGSIRLNRPITGMVPTPSGNGYWFVASDGGVFSFGDARFLGSAAGTGADIAGMVAPAR